MFFDALDMVSHCRIGLPSIASAFLAPSARPAKAFFTRGEIAVVVVYLLLGHILRIPKELLPWHDLASIRRRLRMGKRKPRSFTETGFDLPQRHYHKPTGKGCQYESGSEIFLSFVVFRKRFDAFEDSFVINPSCKIPLLCCWLNAVLKVSVWLCKDFCSNFS